MMLHIPGVLSPADVAQMREALEAAEWEDGRVTAGHLAVRTKANLQLPVESPLAVALGQRILERLGQTPLFIAAALPLRVLPPRFNRYEGGGTYGSHIDNALFRMPGTDTYVRTDLSSTVFLSEPDSYEGGELVVEDSYGAHRVKLAAGDMVLYPGTSHHHVTPVTRGTRLAAFSGRKASFLPRPTAAACSRWIRRSRRWRANSPIIPRSPRSPASITTCCAAGR
jgi:PKHD-type hydroxylase